MVEINWMNSSSNDVSKTRLFKGFKDSTILINEIPAGYESTSYSDSTINNGLVTYFLTAVDSSGNESVKSNIIQLNAEGKSKENDLKLSVIVDRRIGVINIKWTSGSVNEGFRLYKAKDEEPISLYKVFSNEVFEFSDDLLEVNSKYHYRLQLINQDGSVSFFSNQVDIVF